MESQLGLRSQEGKRGFVAPRRGTGTSWARADAAGISTWWPQEVTVSLQEGVMGLGVKNKSRDCILQQTSKKPTCEESQYSCKCSAMQQMLMESLNSLVGRGKSQSHTEGTVVSCPPEPLLIGCEKKAWHHQRRGNL